MHVTIATVGEVYFDGKALSLSAPGKDGDVTIMPHHIPLVTTLREGTLWVRIEGDEKSFPVKSGVLEVHKEGAIVLL